MPKREKARKRVTAIPPESPAARDEGPRLISLPDGDPNQNLGVPRLPTDGYVALADKAIRIWNKVPKEEKPDRKARKSGD